jgi:hypothetical protein
MLRLSWHGSYSDLSYTWYVREMVLGLWLRFSVQAQDVGNMGLEPFNTEIAKLANEEFSKYIKENEL